MAELFMVASPIGNLKDITLRALEILSGVDVIACEDTRHSLRLLNAHNISKPLIPCHARNEESASHRIIALLEQGKSVAYLSDAGTPGISDPGGVLASSAERAGFPVVPVPGPSAMTALISVTGIRGSGFSFAGFLSPKGGKRKNQLKKLMNNGDAFIVYESPYRIIKLLHDLSEVCSQLSDPRQVSCGRELTKIHEELIKGSPEQVAQSLEGRTSVKGEFVVLIQAAEKGLNKLGKLSDTK